MGGIFSFNSIDELTLVIIPHFYKYLILTQNRLDFIMFKKAVDIMNNKQHLTLEGLSKIIRIRVSINKGLSETLSVNFLDPIPAVKPCVEPISILNPNWLTGFPSSDLCFNISINKSKPSLGYAIQ